MRQITITVEEPHPLNPNAILRAQQTVTTEELNSRGGDRELEAIYHYLGGEIDDYKHRNGLP